MPTSDLSSFFDIMETLARVNARSILDVGVGFGKWGVLIREYFDLRPHKKKGYDDWAIKLDGIEVNEKYLTPLHSYIYNEIFIGEAIEILSTKNLFYELLLALDILEHFTRENAVKFLKLCLNRSKTVFINTPNIYYKIQKEHYNEYMDHKSGWTANDFKELGARYVWHSGIYVLALFTDSEISLPLENEIQEDHIDKTDLIKIKDLINMYYQTSQIQACLDACEKYTRFFPEDQELSRMAARCHEHTNRA